MTSNNSMQRYKKITEIRKKLKNGQVCIGSWMQLPNGSVAEIMGSAGYDWVAVDLEHGSISTHQLPDLFRGIETCGTLPLVRLSQAHPKDCKRSLDAGAGGVIVPMVESPEQLKNIIEHCAWPPAGQRGVGFSRANLFGKNFEEYKEEAQSPIIVAQIENIRAVTVLEQILAVSGLDAILIGPYDLSASMGLTGQFEALEYTKVLEKIKTLSLQFNIPFGIHVVQPDLNELKARILAGFQFIAYSIDSVFLYNGAECPKF
jgi:2-dehydro-3-deoxyglucarate aldolase